MSAGFESSGQGEMVQSRRPWPGHFLQCFPFLRGSRQESAQRERVLPVASEDPAEACRDPATPLVVDVPEHASSRGMSAEAQLEFVLRASEPVHDPFPAQRYSIVGKSR